MSLPSEVPPAAAIPADLHSDLAGVAEQLRRWSGPIVVLAHVDPDGDALGSVLTAARALRRLGKHVIAPIEAPRYLAFLAQPDECQPALAALPADALVLLLDCDPSRAWGAPLANAAPLVNLDHHPGNRGPADTLIVRPELAASAVLVKHLVDALGLAWDAELATPCLCGILTDTGTFRFANTDRHTLAVAGDLIAAGVDYAELTDRLQWRPASYFQRLAAVLGTVRFEFGGALVTLEQSAALRAKLPGDDDSDDFVGLVRYAEGVRLAAYLRDVEGGVKISLRSRAGASARAVAQALGGGGHEVAAGARLPGVSLAEARERLVRAAAEALGAAPTD